jgi:hypothetical protein
VVEVGTCESVVEVVETYKPVLVQVMKSRELMRFDIPNLERVLLIA